MNSDSEEELTMLARLILDLQKRMKLLEQMAYYQGAYIQTIEDYIALSSDDPEQTGKLLKNMQMETYHQHMTKLEDLAPGTASRVDVRAGLSEEEKRLWYLIRDETENGEK